MKNISLIIFILVIVNIHVFSSESLIFGCDQSESSFSEHNKKTTLYGNAYVKTKSLDINSDKIELYGTDYRFANCIGNVVIFNKDENFIIKSDKLV